MGSIHSFGSDGVSGWLVLGVHCRAQRLWYSIELKEKYRIEEEGLRAQKSLSKQPELIQAEAAVVASS
jgi:hypothetical protein